MSQAFFLLKTSTLHAESLKVKKQKVHYCRNTTKIVELGTYSYRGLAIYVGPGFPTMGLNNNKQLKKKKQSLSPPRYSYEYKHLYMPRVRACAICAGRHVHAWRLHVIRDRRYEYSMYSRVH